MITLISEDLKDAVFLFFCPEIEMAVFQRKNGFRRQERFHDDTLSSVSGSDSLEAGFMQLGTKM